MVGAELREVIELLKQSTQAPSVDTILAGDGNRTAPPAPDTPEATESWIEQPNHAKWSRLGQMMIERGFVTDEQLEQALVQQRTTGRRVGETFLEFGVISSVDLAKVLADHLGVPFVDLQSRPPDLVLAALVPEHIARRYNALPVARWGGQLVVAMANPNDVFALDDLRVLTGQPIIAALAEPQHLTETIDRAYQHSQVESTLGDALDRLRRRKRSASPVRPRRRRPDGPVRERAARAGRRRTRRPTCTSSRRTDNVIDPRAHRRCAARHLRGAARPCCAR